MVCLCFLRTGLLYNSEATNGPVSDSNEARRRGIQKSLAGMNIEYFDRFIYFVLLPVSLLVVDKYLETKLQSCKTSSYIVSQFRPHLWYPFLHSSFFKLSYVCVLNKQTFL